MEQDGGSLGVPWLNRDSDDGFSKRDRHTRDGEWGWGDIGKAPYHLCIAVSHAPTLLILMSYAQHKVTPQATGEIYLLYCFLVLVTIYCVHFSFVYYDVQLYICIYLGSYP